MHKLDEALQAGRLFRLLTIGPVASWWRLHVPARLPGPGLPREEQIPQFDRNSGSR